jgi:acetyl-CoA C-acetyltransferase
MGIGPVPALGKLLRRAGWDTGSLELIEVNEAFAAQAVAVCDELKLDPERVNVNGGAIAIGHPLGASGVRLMTTMLNHLETTGGRFGFQTMCEGGGQANATVIERLG